MSDIMSPALCHHCGCFLRIERVPIEKGRKMLNFCECRKPKDAQLPMFETAP